MAYKEPHFDKAGAKAFYEAISQMNDNVTKGGSKTKKSSTAKSSTAKKNGTKKKSTTAKKAK